MEYKKILDRLSPCGIRCDTCFAFKGGEISKHSQALSRHLGNFQNYAPRFSELLEEPVFNVYPYFKLHLDYFSNAECKGCRKEHCRLLKSCRVRSCIEEKGVDFCFQCEKFPCRETGFDENLERRWKQNNLLMKEQGVENYFALTRNDSRYA